MLEDVWVVEQITSLRRQTGVGWPVLTYHLVDPKHSDRNCVPPAQFTRHIDILSENGFVFRAIDDLCTTQAAAPPDKTSVLLAFDDAYTSVLEYAHPLLEKRQIPYTVFVPVDCVNKANLWNTKARYLTRHLSWTELRAMAKYSVAFGSHGCSHHSLVKFSSDRIVEELKRSQATLKQELGVPVHYVAYPYGDVSPVVETIASQYYRLGFSAAQGEWSWSNRPWAINRISIHATDSADSILAVLKQFRNIFGDD